jgi:hypothetical protein
MNGLVDGTLVPKSEGPPNPNYYVSTTLQRNSANHIVAEATLPVEFAIGFTGGVPPICPPPPSYVDYFIGSTPGSYLYSHYPINNPTDTHIFSRPFQQPPQNPPDGARNPQLPLASILYLNNWKITRNTLREGDGLAVKIPPLPLSYSGRKITFLFYMNGFITGTPDRISGSPPDPNYIVTTTIPDPVNVNGRTASVNAKLPVEFAQGFGISVETGEMLWSFVDYFIGDGEDGEYGPYPTAKAKTST